MSGDIHQQTGLERIDLYLTDDMPIYDSNSEQIGHVKMFSTVAGYLIVGHGPVEKDNLYIPFRLIQNIDPREIFLSEPKQTLLAGYATPPKISTLTEHRLVRTPDRGLKTESRQAQIVQSGYDGLPARINSVDTDSIAHRLAVGMAVYDASGARLGDVTQYDAARSLFAVESRIFKPQVLFVPFSAIQSIDGEAFTVHLALPRDVIVKSHSMLPADAE
jgi:ribosomal 30S subunit maturation factor RimM